MKNPILEEIWKYREEYAAKFNYDMDAIFDDIKKREKKSKFKKVKFEPKQMSKMDLEKKHINKTK